MNKTKRTVSQRVSKKMHKELKAAQHPLAPEIALRSDQLTEKDLIKGYPKRVVKKDLALLTRWEKRMQNAKRKKLKKHSKRTTCGTVDEHSPPAHVHPEGARWMKSLTQQNTIERKRLQHKLTKKIA